MLKSGQASLWFLNCKLAVAGVIHTGVQLHAIMWVLTLQIIENRFTQTIFEKTRTTRPMAIIQRLSSRD